MNEQLEWGRNVRKDTPSNTQHEQIKAREEKANARARDRKNMKYIIVVERLLRLRIDDIRQLAGQHEQNQQRGRENVNLINKTIKQSVSQSVE